MEWYNRATKMLERQVRFTNMPDGFRARHNMVKTVRLLRTAFIHPLVRQDTLLPMLEPERVAQGRFSAGFCGVASYTWSHLFRMPDGTEIWRLKSYSGNHEFNGLTDHVWLENKFDGSILDLTFDQSIDAYGTYIEIPYFLGNYVDSDFEFARAYRFATHMGIDLSDIVFENALRRALSGRM